MAVLELELGVNSRSVRLSQWTAGKRKRCPKDVEPADHARVQHIPD